MSSKVKVGTTFSEPRAPVTGYKGHSPRFRTMCHRSIIIHDLTHSRTLVHVLRVLNLYLKT